MDRTMIDIENLLDQIHAAIHVMDEKGLPVEGREINLPYFVEKELRISRTKEYIQDDTSLSGKICGIKTRFLSVGKYEDAIACVYWESENEEHEKGVDGIWVAKRRFLSLPLRLIEMEETEAADSRKVE